MCVCWHERSRPASKNLSQRSTLSAGIPPTFVDSCTGTHIVPGAYGDTCCPGFIPTPSLVTEHSELQFNYERSRRLWKCSRGSNFSYFRRTFWTGLEKYFSIFVAKSAETSNPTSWPPLKVSCTNSSIFCCLLYATFPSLIKQWILLPKILDKTFKQVAA